MKTLVTFWPEEGSEQYMKQRRKKTEERGKKVIGPNVFIFVTLEILNDKRQFKLHSQTSMT